MPAAPSASSFYARHEFLIRRLFSLCGLVPVGAYMVIHLLTNASLINSVNTYQNSVYMIHSLGVILPLVEWTFIFLPIIFHGVIGLYIVANGRPNYNTYKYGSNFRYTMQRVTGLIAFVFIFWHVFHMHGWFHFGWWEENISRPLGGAQFKPYNAGSTLAMAFQGSVLVPILYAIGVGASVYHLANGIWSFGITWGLWTTPDAQRRALRVSAVFGILLFGVSMAAWMAPLLIDPEEAYANETRVYEARVESGAVTPDEHKQWKRPEGEPRPSE